MWNMYSNIQFDYLCRRWFSGKSSGSKRRQFESRIGIDIYDDIADFFFEINQ